MTKPDATNTGVLPQLSKYTGPLTITVDGTIIENKDVYGDLKIQAKNVVIRNCRLRGGTTHPGSNTGIVDANSGRVVNLLVENCVIRPDFPSWYRDGIVGHDYTARRNHICRSNDGLGIFNKPGGNGQANVVADGNYIHNLTHWNHDPAHSDGTHNDCIQIQGGANIRVVGNNIVASAVAGDGLGKLGNHVGAGLLAQQNTGPLSNCIIENNWFDMGGNSVCINHAKQSKISLTLRNNLFGRNQFDFGNGSKYPIRIYSKSASNITGLGTNRWEDTKGILMEGRNSGIRFNAA